jgi:hypothetical protein
VTPLAQTLNFYDGDPLRCATRAGDTYRADEARLGLLSGVDAGTSGTAYFDAFESRRSTYIGPAGGGLGRLMFYNARFYSASGCVVI